MHDFPLSDSVFFICTSSNANTLPLRQLRFFHFLRRHLLFLIQPPSFVNWATHPQSDTLHVPSRSAMPCPRTDPMLRVKRLIASTCSAPSAAPHALQLTWMYPLPTVIVARAHTALVAGGPQLPGPRFGAAERPCLGPARGPQPRGRATLRGAAPQPPGTSGGGLSADPPRWWPAVIR